MSLFWKTWSLRAMLIVLFIASLSLILFNANGLQYDFFSNQIRKTGIINVTFADKKAIVYLDGEKLKGTLPFAASDVLPGNYHLVITREGFWDYQVDVKVNEDLISTIDSGFLYPIDTLSNSRLILDNDTLQNKNVLFREDYIFIHEKNKLSFSRLNPVLTKTTLVKANVLAIPIAQLEVLENEAVITYNDGRRQILNLLSAQVEDVKWPAKNLYIDNKWLHYEKNLLAVFDRNLNNVIWAHYLPEGREIKKVVYKSVNHQEFISVYLDNINEGYFYQIKDNKLKLIDNAPAELAGLDSSDNIIYLKNSQEIWKYNLNTQKTELLSRFASPIELLAMNLEVYKSKNLVIFQQSKNYFIADSQFSNVRPMFSGLEIGAVKLVENKIYYLNYFKKPDQADEVRLLMLNLEN